MTKKMLLIGWLTLVFSGIGWLFWHNEWKYSLPTPVPANYHAVSTGTFIDLKNEVHQTQNKPVFLHFFNPDCPCSRFNIREFKSLVKQYGDRISFSVIALCKDNSYTVNDIQDKFGLDLPVLFDSSIATTCGVYSTPQAVLINTDNKLYYRGNYNKSRYCTDKNSNYAQMAIDSLLHNNVNPLFALAAIKSYGCTLPSCSK
jgi:hypothetical protein